MPELTEDPVVNGTQEEDSDSDSTDGAAVSSILAPKPTDLGKRVLFYSVQDKKQKYGVLRFVGTTEFSEGMWCGIELDRPVGKNNGSIHGIRYFVCEPNHGVFVPLNKVELDTSRRSRSRPNSAPSSRNSSLERKKQSGGSSAMVPAASSTSSSPKINPYILQKDLVNRLSQPAIHKRKSGTSPATSYRQPMKAFGRKDDVKSPFRSGGEDSNTKKTLAPFRSGGMVKAQSTENLRGLREKDKKSNMLKVGMPAKKSSSERDLRSSSTGNLSKSSKSNSSNKPLKKKGRVNSCSDLLDSSDTSNSSNKSGTSSEFNSRKSGDTLSLFSESSTSHIWPRTSTPGNRDDQTPDGCSSPDDMSDSQSSSNTSMFGGQNGQGVEKVTPNINEKAFIKTPETSVCNDQLKPIPTGLATQTNQFMENERMSPSLEPCRVPSPEGVHSKQRYKNRPSGSATIQHPLTSTIANTIEENHISNGTTHCMTPQEFVKNIVGPDGTLRGVSPTKIESLYSEQFKLWTSTQVLLENRVHQLEKQAKEQCAEISKYQRLLNEAEDSKSKNRSVRERSHQMDSLKLSQGEERISRHTAV